MCVIKILVKHISGIAILLLLPFSIQATQVFTYEETGFSVTVPTGWIAIPPYMVKSAVRAASQFAPTIPTQHYQYGFQFDTAGGWFSYPYVLIGIKPLRQISTQDLENIINLQHTKKIDKVKDILQPLIGNIKVRGINYEPSSQIIWLRTDTDNVETGLISSIYGIILTKQGAVQVTGFIKRDEFEKYFPVFENIIRSVKVNKPIAYPKQPVEITATYSIWHFVIAGILISLIFILIFLLVIRRGTKTPAAIDENKSTPAPPIEEQPTIHTPAEATQPLVEEPITSPLILPKTQTHYDILGVDPAAEESEIKRAAQAKLKEVKAELEALGAHERSVYGKIAKSKGERIKKAFHTLSDVERRRKYDASLPQAKTNTASKSDVTTNSLLTETVPNKQDDEN